MKNETDRPASCCPLKSGGDRDRYVSFIGLDCDGQARRIMARLRPYFENPDHPNPFWKWFASKLNPESGPRHDELFLIHAHLNILREQLESEEDSETLALLDKIEQECC